jgi:hypothetical protein
MDERGKPAGDDDSPVLKCQLDFLKLEFEAINKAIERLDETTQATKNWAVVLWAGSLGVALGKPEMHPYIPITAALPLLFWFIDAQWRRIQRSFIFRSHRISDFLNGPALTKSIENGRLTDFIVLDLRAGSLRNTPEYRDFTSIRRTCRFKEVGPFYVGLALISLLVAAALH